MSDEYLVRAVDDMAKSPRIGTVMAPDPSGDPDYCIVTWWGTEDRQLLYWGDLVTVQTGLYGDDL